MVSMSPLAQGGPALYTSMGPTSTPGGFSGQSFGAPGLPFGFGFPSFGDPLFYFMPAASSFFINRLLGFANGSAVNINVGPTPSHLGMGALLLGQPFYADGGDPGSDPAAGTPYQFDPFGPQSPGYGTSYGGGGFNSPPGFGGPFGSPYQAAPSQFGYGGPFEGGQSQAYNPYGGGQSQAYNPYGGGQSQAYNPYGGGYGNPYGGGQSQAYNPYGGGQSQAYNPYGGGYGNPFGGNNFFGGGNNFFQGVA